MKFPGNKLYQTARIVK